MYAQGAKAKKQLTQEALRDAAAQVNAAALDRLLQHTRRGSLLALWIAALAEANARLAACEDAPAGEHHVSYACSITDVHNALVLL